jgi:hypothetical protein
MAEPAMPSLFKLLLVVGVICGLIYGAMFALATFVNPAQRQITTTVSPERFLKPR